jgi:hypothetical protein
MIPGKDLLAATAIFPAREGRKRDRASTGARSGAEEQHRGRRRGCAGETPKETNYDTA